MHFEPINLGEFEPGGPEVEVTCHLLLVVLTRRTAHLIAPIARKFSLAEQIVDVVVLTGAVRCHASGHIFVRHVACEIFLDVFFACRRCKYSRGSIDGLTRARAETYR